MSQDDSKGFLEDGKLNSKTRIKYMNRSLVPPQQIEDSSEEKLKDESDSIDASRKDLGEEISD